MHEELTELSKQYLNKFFKYCNKHKIFPVLVGGWAVWSYTKADYSVDIDIVLKNKSEIKKIKPFFDAHKLKEEINGGISFVKQVSQEGIGPYKLKHLIFDVSFFSDKNALAEDKKIVIPWKLVEKNSVKTKISKFEVLVPIPELLLIQKAKALKDRTYLKYKLEGFERGISKKRREFKIDKDQKDIKNLLKLKIDDKKLNQLLKKTKFLEYFEDTVNALKA